MIPAKNIKIRIDPGHGGSDPGVVDEKRHITEKYANLETAFTLKYLLTLEGFPVTMSRTDDKRPTYPERVEDVGQQLTIALHYNSANTYPCVYHQLRGGKSQSFAECLAHLAGIPATKVWDAKSSRFPQLYIDDAHGMAILWEVDAITGFEDSKEYRMARCTPVVKAIKAYFDVR